MSTNWALKSWKSFSNNSLHNFSGLEVDIWHELCYSSTQPELSWVCSFVISLSSFQEYLSRLLEQHLKLFLGRWLPFNSFSIKMIPHASIMLGSRFWGGQSMSDLYPIERLSCCLSDVFQMLMHSGSKAVFCSSINFKRSPAPLTEIKY